MSPVRNTLAQYSPLSGLAPGMLATLSGRAVRRRFEKGTHLWHEGDLAVALTVVARGRVKIVKHAPGGRDVLVEICGAGEAPGEASVFDGERHSASAIALEDVEVVQLPTQELLAALESDSQTTLSVLRVVAHHVRKLSRRVTDLCEGGVERRLAVAMCRLCETVEARNGGPVELAVPLSRQDLADMVGTSLETAIRVMSKWSRKGVVATERGGFVVKDCAALQKLVGQTPRGAEKGGTLPVCIRKLPL